MTAKALPPLRAGAVRCETMTDVRREIDRVDRLITELLCERISYIEQAGIIKPDRNTVRDEARIEDVVSKVEATGAPHDPPAGYLSDVYRHLIEWSIAHEFDIYDERD